MNKILFLFVFLVIMITSCQEDKKSEELVITAKITAKEGQKEIVKKALLDAITPTINEKGCVKYDLHVDRNDLNCFFFYEEWESRELWQDHMNSTHIKELLQKTEGLLEGVDILELSKIN